MMQRGKTLSYEFFKLDMHELLNYQIFEILISVILKIHKETQFLISDGSSTISAI